MGSSESQETAPSGETIQLRHQRMRLEQRLFGRPQTLKVGRYALSEMLGEGGMGSVYAARDPALGRRVAIKVLHHRFSASTRAAARLVREAKAMAKIQHPHVLTVHEVGIEGGQPFVAAELMTGGTLAGWASSHSPDEPGRTERALVLLRQCAEGLAAAHAAGLVHRDFKPHNVLLTDNGDAKVADFGLVLAVFDDRTIEQLEDPVSTLDAGGPLTGEGANPGTPHYMAPEQHSGVADERSDQYALCQTFLDIFGTRCPPKLLPILERGRQAEPDQRFANLGELIAEFDRAMTPAARRPAIVMSALVMGILAVGAIVRLNPPPPASATAELHPCDDGGQQVERLWNDEQRQRLRAAFETSGSTSWRQAWSGVDTRVGQYVDDWSAAVLDTCEATHVRRVQDEDTMHMREACLGQRWSALEDLLSAYAEGDARVVDNAITTSHALPQIALCADRRELEFGTQSRGLDEPEIRAAYDALGHAESLFRLDQRSEASEAYERLQPELERLALPGLLSVSARTRATLAVRTGDYEEAARLARVALDHAEQADRDRETVLAWVAMSEIARMRGELDDSDLYLERAENLVGRRPDALALHAEVTQVRAANLEARGKPKLALEAYEKTMDLAAEVGSSPVGRLKIAINTLDTLSVLGRDELAHERGKAVLAEARELLGPSHPVSLLAAVNYAQLLARIGQWETVVELLRETPGISMRTRRADLLVNMRLLYATGLAEQGRIAEAEVVIEALIAEGTPLLGNDHRALLTARGQLAAIYMDEKDYERALALLQSMEPIVGRQIEGDADGKMHPLNRCGHWVNVALSHSHLGQHAEAIDAADRSVAIVESVAAPRSVWVFTTHRHAGEVYERAGRTARALASFELAQSIARERKVDPEELAFVEAGLARLR